MTARRFAAAMAAFAPFEPAPCLVVAVSGGRDSMALCLLADQWSRERGGEVIAVTVDHGLRPDSAAEARRVGTWLAARGIPHHIETLHGPWPSGGVQAQARMRRYERLDRFCGRHGALHLLSAHHAADQAETLSMRLARPGQGPRGAAGMSAERELIRCRLLRPLLGWDRGALEAVLRRAGQDWIDDPSNFDPGFERVRVRQAASGIGISSDAVHQRLALDRAMAELAVKAVTVSPYGSVSIDLRVLEASDPVVGRELLSATLRFVSGSDFPPRRAKIADLYGALDNGTARSLGGCLIDCRSDKVMVHRELGRMRDRRVALRAQSVLWDGRFRCSVPEDGLLAPLGRNGVAEWRSRDDFPDPPDVAAAQLATLPGIWRSNMLLRVPLLERIGPLGIVSAESAPEMEAREHGCSFPISFSPTRSLISAPFVPAPILD